MLSIDLIQPRFRVVAFRRYVQGFRGFERDARVFLVATLFSGAAISL
ncbi:MAG: hypothetical protein H0W00_04820, partial [Chloroflexi bacterium]|nr:hypothetical protein [Chloroflexota bacterium]